MPCYRCATSSAAISAPIHPARSVVANHAASGKNRCVWQHSPPKKKKTCHASGANRSVQRHRTSIEFGGIRSSATSSAAIYAPTHAMVANAALRY
ncbi:unnamed protein product [Allacma fusca]|uniref:Uncharacterized protein n=1 Tax=Allacma fusca TaxID=39272 RepID=A0A8J2K0W1_9HEXA|nr:unnamed protein product [Allacma fusca]